MFGDPDLPGWLTEMTCIINFDKIVLPEAVCRGQMGHTWDCSALPQTLGTPASPTSSTALSRSTWTNIYQVGGISQHPSRTIVFGPCGNAPPLSSTPNHERHVVKPGPFSLPCWFEFQYVKKQSTQQPQAASRTDYIKKQMSSKPLSLARGLPALPTLLERQACKRKLKGISR